jgi:hypothetical protein
MKAIQAIGLMCCVLALGCARGPQTYHVSGQVTFQGQPLPRGVIFFDPDPKRQNTGPQGYAYIKDGRFDTSQEDGRGVVGGAYIARIDGFDGKPGAELPFGSVLFTQFQQSLELPAAGPAVQDFEVPESQS